MSMLGAVAIVFLFVLDEAFDNKIPDSFAGLTILFGRIVAGVGFLLVSVAVITKKHLTILRIAAFVLSGLCFTLTFLIMEPVW